MQEQNGQRSLSSDGGWRQLLGGVRSSLLSAAGVRKGRAGARPDEVAVLRRLNAESARALEATRAALASADARADALAARVALQSRGDEAQERADFSAALAALGAATAEVDPRTGEIARLREVRCLGGVRLVARVRRAGAQFHLGCVRAAGRSAERR